MDTITCAAAQGADNPASHRTLGRSIPRGLSTAEARGAAGYVKRFCGTSSAVLLCAAVLLPTVSHAIVWGEPDGDAHPNVGALILVFDNFSPIPLPGIPENILPICSGSVVARDGNRALYLTAGHCVDAVASLMAAFAPLNPVAAVSFSSDLHADLGITIPVDMGALYREFGPLPPAFPNTGVLRDMVDIGLLVLEAENPTDLPEPVTLAPAGWLDAIGSAAFHASEFRVVGYGDDITPPTPHTRAFVFGVREVAYPRALNLSENWLVAHQHGPSGSSGVFFGDSGGPTFWVNPATGEEVQAAQASAPLGNLDVVAVTQHFRIDTPYALDFIAAVKAAEGF